MNGVWVLISNNVQLYIITKSWTHKNINKIQNFYNSQVFLRWRGNFVIYKWCVLFTFLDGPSKAGWHWTWGEEVKEISPEVECREHVLPELSLDISTFQPLQGLHRLHPCEHTWKWMRCVVLQAGSAICKWLTAGGPSMDCCAAIKCSAHLSFKGRQWMQNWWICKDGFFPRCYFCALISKTLY